MQEAISAANFVVISMADVAPNQTIYVNNLPEKIGKEGERTHRWCSVNWLR